MNSNLLPSAFSSLAIWPLIHCLAFAFSSCPCLNPKIPKNPKEKVVVSESRYRFQDPFFFFQIREWDRGNWGVLWVPMYFLNLSNLPIWACTQFSRCGVSYRTTFIKNDDDMLEQSTFQGKEVLWCNCKFYDLLKMPAPTEYLLRRFSSVS